MAGQQSSGDDAGIGRRPFADGDFDAVLAAARANDPVAFQRLHAAFAPNVAGYLRLQGAVEADDLTSEVFLAVFTRLDSFAGDEAAFRSWMFTIAHRRLIDEHRRRGRRPVTYEADTTAVELPSAEDAGDVVDRRLADARVMALCDQLLPDQRSVILLRIVADLTVEQTATALGKSTGAVKQLQRRGLLNLQKIVRHEGVTL